MRFEVIVVDNASADGSADAIRAAYPQVRLVRASTATSGSPAPFNLAARSAGGDYVLLLNPDTVILDGAVQRAVAFAPVEPARGDRRRPDVLRRHDAQP